jgi:pectin methylesterase-like acyl-CoA thioesterase
MKHIFLKFLVILMVLTVNAYGYDFIVAKDGSGNYTTLQEAINAAPTGRITAFTIFIKNGRYKEKITIPSSKPFIQMIGESVANTILTYDDYAGKNTSCNTTLGTQNSASFTINATDFTAINITFENSYGDGSQAVAVLVNADRAVFKNCRLLGNQDTLYVKGGNTPKCYFKACYIDGNIDFIFGSSIALFDSCVLYAKTRPATATSYITAPNTPAGQPYGFIFRDAKLPNNTGGTLYYLSRPWPSPSEALTAQNIIFLNASMSSHIHPAGWSVWNASTITANLNYAEYQSRYFNGTFVDAATRVPWSFQLTSQQATTYSMSNIFGAWDPCAQNDICNSLQPDIAVSNFRVAKGVSSSVINWNISWPMSGIQYTVFRTTDNVSYSPLYTETALTDTVVNFQYTDFTAPPAGSSYSYYLIASKAGHASHITDTLIVSNASSLQVNAPATLSLCGFNQVLGTPSASQAYTITGSNLLGNVTITPSTDFEVSVNNVNWFNSFSPLIITPVAGSVATTNVFARLNAAAVDIYSGNISNTSDGITTIYVPVKGRTTPPSTSIVLQAWALTTNNEDSAAVRSEAVIPSISTLYNLHTTDETMPAPTGTVPAYSNQYGQVFGANAAGNNWQNVGGSLKRAYYEEFSVTASAGNSLRIDSIIFNSNFYGTMSGIKMAAVYSKNGFSSPADSSEFSDGVGPAGSVLVLSASGGFAKSFPLAQNNSGPLDRYALSLNGANGVALNAGETVNIRLYWACGSTGTPRFALLKNVMIKGIVTTPVPLLLVSFTAAYANNRVKLNWLTEQEANVKDFDVQRSNDGMHFVTVGNIIAKNTSGHNNYSFFDDYKDLAGIAFYRLKIKDRNGSFVYSNINSVNIKRADELKIVPNLVDDNVFVFHSKATEGAKIEIYSFDGRKILSQTVMKDAVQTTISASNMLTGGYNLVYVNNINVEFVKFVKR